MTPFWPLTSRAGSRRNCAADEMLGLSKSDMLGRQLSSIFDLPAELRAAADGRMSVYAHEMT